MRKQEYQKLKSLCSRHDLDIQNYDTKAHTYAQLKEMILKDAGVVTEEMERDKALEAESMAEFYDSLPISERAYIAEELQKQVEVVNCLVIKVNWRKIGLAKALLLTKYKGNLMTRNFSQEGVFEPVNQTIWIMGKREATTMILEDLQNHNIYFKVLRNYPFRLDFFHYYNGEWYHMSRKNFKEVVKAQSKRKLRQQKALKLI